METMRPGDKPKHQQPAPASAEDGIPVYELYFCVGYRNPDLPFEGVNGGTGRITLTPERAKSLSIMFLPRQRCFKLTGKSNLPGGKVITCYVPESWAAWVPMEAR